MFLTYFFKIPVSLRFLSVSVLAGAALSWTYWWLRLPEGWTKPALYPDQSSDWLGI